MEAILSLRNDNKTVYCMQKCSDFQQQKTESVLVTKENQSVNYNFSSIEYLCYYQI
jgi:hypothetical protein